MTNSSGNSGFSIISSSYTSGFRVGARKCLPLAFKLEVAAPEGLTPDGRARLEAVKARGQEVADVLTWRQRATSSFVGDRRRQQAMAFTALQQRIGALTGLPADLGPKGAEATFLLGTLFTDDVSLSDLDSVDSWEQGMRIRSRIEREGLRARIDAIAGPELMLLVERANDDLGIAIGVTGDKKAPRQPPRALADAKLRFTTAVSAYARLLAGQVDESSPESIERFTKAMLPIDEMRSRDGGGDDVGDDARDEEDEEDAPATPVVARPPVAPAPPIEPGMPGADPFIRNP